MRPAYAADPSRSCCCVPSCCKCSLSGSAPMSFACVHACMHALRHALMKVNQRKECVITKAVRTALDERNQTRERRQALTKEHLHARQACHGISANSPRFACMLCMYARAHANALSFAHALSHMLPYPAPPPSHQAVPHARPPPQTHRHRPPLLPLHHYFIILPSHASYALSHASYSLGLSYVLCWVAGLW